MRLLYLADGRSPIALNWIGYFVEQGHEVHLVSFYPCAPALNLASVTIIPIPFSTGGDGYGVVSHPKSWRRRLIANLATAGLRTTLRHWLVPPALPRVTPALLAEVEKVKPDLVHAMRVPYEGMLAGFALKDERTPLILSIWGNDFTLHASSTPAMRQATRLAMIRADGLHSDCRRDLRLAYDWGFSRDKPAVVLPGAGGIRADVFYPPEDEEAERSQPVLIHARGLRAYVRNDTIFKAFAVIQREIPNVRMFCPAMAGSTVAEGLLKRYGRDAVQIWPRLTQEDLADLYRRSQVALSITEHDGTPNTLLEAMACGCFPIAGNIESLREWIVDGKNGLLIPPDDPDALAQAAIRALRDAQLRRSAQVYNYQRIAEQAEYNAVMQSAESFYRSILEE